MTFDIESFVSHCKQATASEVPQRTVAELLKTVVSDSANLVTALKPDRAKLEKLYVSDELTILNVVWAPRMTLLPHNHNIWAVIGVYTGREDNIFWRRIKDDPDGKIEAAGAKSIAAGDVEKLGRNIVHSVTNPTAGFTGAIHVYGGNFFEQERSEWDPLNLHERDYSVQAALDLFESENAMLEYQRQAADR